MAFVEGTQDENISHYSSCKAHFHDEPTLQPDYRNSIRLYIASDEEKGEAFALTNGPNKQFSFALITITALFRPVYFTASAQAQGRPGPHHPGQFYAQCRLRKPETATQSAA